MLNSEKGFVAVLLIAVSVMSIGACAGSGYSPPGKADENVTELETVISRPFNETWQTILNHVMHERYMIDAYDKASGTITVSFGRSNPSRFVDCGLFDDHSLLDWPNWRRELNAVMTVRLASISPSETQVVANTDYSLYGHFIEYWGSASVVDRAEWRFKSLGTDEQQFVTERIGKLHDKWIGAVTCRPTHVAERGIIDALSNLSTD